MKFSDYYEEHEDVGITPSCSREENLEKLREAILDYGYKHGQEARVKVAAMKIAQDVFGDQKNYDDFCMPFSFLFNCLC